MYSKFVYIGLTCTYARIVFHNTLFIENILLLFYGVFSNYNNMPN